MSLREVAWEGLEGERVGRNDVNAILMYENVKKHKGKIGFTKIKIKYSSIESIASEKVLLHTIPCIMVEN